MNAETVRSIVPAFFVVQSPAANADEVAADLTMLFNKKHKHAVPGVSGALYLCEASPTTEWDSPEDPHSLEGLTCDSGSDRSATGLIRTIADYTDTDPQSALSGIKQLAEGWLRHRIALRPRVTVIHGEADPLVSAVALIRDIAAIEACSNSEPSAMGPALDSAVEKCQAWLRDRQNAAQAQEDAIDLLFHAYARSETKGHALLSCEDVEAAMRQGMAERPGRYEEVLAMHVYQAEADKMAAELAEQVGAQ